MKTILVVALSVFAALCLWSFFEQIALGEALPALAALFVSILVIYLARVICADFPSRKKAKAV